MKELRDYSKLLKKYLLMAAVLAVVANGAVWFYLSNQPKGYLASATFYVNRIPEARNTQYYTFEGYYAGLASKEYTDVVVGLLKSTDIQRLADERAKVTSAQVTVRKTSPQLINVAVIANSEDEARKKLVALAEVTSERSRSLARSENQGAEVSLVNPEPSVGPYQEPFYIYFGIATLASLLLTILIGVIREYFRI